MHCKEQIALDQMELRIPGKCEIGLPIFYRKIMKYKFNH